MQKPYVIAYLLVPADQHAPEAVHPTMGALDDPPPGFETDLVLECAGLLTPCLDMGCEPKLVEQGPYFIIIIAFVQTHPLWSLGGGIGPLHRDALDGLTGQLEII